jgi:hypothetical protein
MDDFFGQIRKFFGHWRKLRQEIRHKSIRAKELVKILKNLKGFEFFWLNFHYFA